jgi:hypothetical protein
VDAESRRHSADHRADREARLKEKQKERAKRGHPIVSFFWGLFSPIVSWWCFIGNIPMLVYCLIVLLALSVGSNVIRVLFRK